MGVLIYNPLVIGWFFCCGLPTVQAWIFCRLVQWDSRTFDWVRTPRFPLFFFFPFFCLLSQASSLDVELQSTRWRGPVPMLRHHGEPETKTSTVADDLSCQFIFQYDIFRRM